MKKAEVFLTLEIGSKINKISDILRLLPNQEIKYYDIGEINERTKRKNDTSFYKYTFQDKSAFDAELFLEGFFLLVKIDELKEIVGQGFTVLLVFHICIPEEREVILPDAGLSANTMMLLGKTGIDYHVQISL
jgi:hypothetical protein